MEGKRKARRITLKIFRRFVFVAILLLIQLFLLGFFSFRANSYYPGYYIICFAIGIASVLGIVSGNANPSYKIGWVILIMALPIFGAPFYLMFGRNKLSRHTRKKMKAITENMASAHLSDSALYDRLQQESPDAVLQARYIDRAARNPVFSHTSVEYHPLGEKSWERMLEELKKAEHYIFMEYFIVEEGIMWNAILEILRRKAVEGLDVRLIYDDFGSITKLPDGYAAKLRSWGIRTYAFNPFIPVINLRMNNRDHRKICVIDGHTGFTGGINLADEYINEKELHGHWKDTAIMMKGDAVWSLTVMFLSMWDFISGEHSAYALYRPQVYQRGDVPSDGYVQPYADNPLDDEPVGENVYLNLINKAKRYVWISTPYLIISNEMMTALTNAAKCGIDVRIITPHIPDKIYVHILTQAHYQRLIEAGVRIFEYTPGFIHAKSFVVDDEYAVVGTINLDYRSLYLHFECATWLYGCSCIADIREDFLSTEAVSHEITLEECKAVPKRKRFIQGLLRLFAPLM